MFIQSKKAFKCKYGSQTTEIPAGFVGSVPDAITNSTMFNWAVTGGDITYVGQPPAAVTVTKTPDQLAAEAAQIAADAAAAAADAKKGKA
jgi:hypothetical protein